MNPRSAIKRELRNASRILNRQELFSDSLIQLAEECIKSAERHGIYPTAVPFKRTCAAYEALDNVIHFHKVTT